LAAESAVLPPRAPCANEASRSPSSSRPERSAHLGLIWLIFPEAPIIHVLRHRLDVVLSVFSNHLTHGFLCAYDLTSIARHYVLVMDLVEHYRREMPLRYLAVRYEDVIDSQEAKVREMLTFLGAL
jgi:hypothetical protein